MNNSKKISGYRVEETLFTSSRTQIQRGIRESDGCSVILKSLSAPFPGTGQLQRFALCHELLQMFDHPNIIKVLDYIETGDSPVMVLEDSHSLDLRDYLKQRPSHRLPLADFLDIAIQLADALSVIHQAQVVHKDLHPGNVLINPNSGLVQVIDFGMASLRSREQPLMSSSGQLEGALPYISPEQTWRMNRALDYRTDFYTLGVTFYELLTGQRPFEADDALGMVYAHIAKEQTPVISLRADIPPILSKIVDKCLKKMAEDRYQSALGLKRDLEKCRDAMMAHTLSIDFTLGEQDISDRFQLSQLLYGRDTEVKGLLNCFQRSLDGDAQLLVVSGYSGIGKSSLVHEIHQPIAAQNGLFASGKFDQFQQNMPYSALQQAFKVWLQHTLTQKETSLLALRERLGQALGSNARVLIDFMPEFEHLLGALPAIPAVGAEETLNRFNIVLRRFIALITENQPLVLFIDDIQWADRGTLNLLPLLINEPNCRLLLIVAYRDNEVDLVHPAMRMLANIKDDNSKQITSLVLEPLSEADTLQLLQSVLHRPDGELKLLAEMVHRKTGGNPFFINELLKTLYSEALLNFDFEQQHWVWDIQEINYKDISNNVVDLMLGKMQRLPEKTQQAMQVASCIGSQFDLKTMAVVTQQSIDEIYRDLWPAIKDGLLVQRRDTRLLDYEHFSDESPSFRALSHSNAGISETLHSSADSGSPQYTFLHDRMLEAAYFSLDEDPRQHLHLKIGRLLREGAKASLHLLTSSPMLFSVVEQLNLAVNLISELPERLELATLNLRAAERAKAANVWDAAANYATKAMSLLPEGAWQNQYELCSDIYRVRIECEYLSNQIEHGNKLSTIALKQLREPLDKADICVLQLIYNMTVNINFAIDQGITGLHFCGLDIPRLEGITDELVAKEESLVKPLLSQVDINLMRGPTNVPKPIQYACRILGRMAPLSNAAGRPQYQAYIINRGIRLAIENKVGESSMSLWAMKSVLLSKQGRYAEAQKIAIGCLALTAQYPKSRDIAIAYSCIGSLCWFYLEPFSEAIALQQKAYEQGIEMGDIQWGAVAGLSNQVINRFVMGEPLSQLSSLLQQLNSLLTRYKKKVAAGSYYIRIVELLMKPNTPNLLDKNAFTAEEWRLIQGCVLKPFLEHLQVQWLFWSDQTEQAWQAVKDAESSLVLMAGFITPLEHRFLAALLACKKYPDATKKEQQVLNDVISCSMNELETLTTLCPENFEHKRLLLLAEQRRVKDEPLETVLLSYDQAIKSAKQGRYIQYHALACELCAKYWLAQGFEMAATHYLRQAYYQYGQWGAEVKRASLRKKYPHVIDERDQPLASLSRSASSVSHTSISSSAESPVKFDDIMKSVQAISGELNLKTLAETGLKLVTESTGAQRSALIMVNTKGLMVEAEISARRVDEPSTPSKLLFECHDLPQVLINDVITRNEELSLSDLTSDSAEMGKTKISRYFSDHYLESNLPKSVFCMPVSYRDKVIGALYLENNEATYSFSEERVKIAKMLISQAVISFENARLFSRSEVLNKTLESKVEQRSNALASANQELQAANEELNAFSYSVSHDLRSPLRGIKGFSQILLQDYAEKLDPMGVELLQRIIACSSKMSDLISGLLELSRVQRRELQLRPVNLSEMVKSIMLELNSSQSETQVSTVFAEHITVPGDEGMLYSAMENLLNNAWKYSSKKAQPSVEFGVKSSEGKTVYFIKDNGAGFDMAHGGKLFGAYQRLHSDREFPGTGIGLATVKRIINKHAGDIWAEAEVENGAIFYFTLWDVLSAPAE